VREMVAETRLSKDMFVYPYFVVPGTNVTHAIDAMPGVNHYSVDTLMKDVEAGMKKGLNKICLPRPFVSTHSGSRVEKTIWRRFIRGY